MTGTSFGGVAFRTIVTDKYGNPTPAPAPMLIKATMADIWVAEKALG
ncbi:MAG: hypothetical protein KJN99_09930 [Marinicaulis sp.]|nr:hypothetical protein [Marinicaulis sp.]